MKITRWKTEGIPGQMVRTTRDEALKIIESLSRQLRIGNTNDGRAEFTTDAGEYFSVSVGGGRTPRLKAPAPSVKENRIPKTKLGTTKVRICVDCKYRVVCTWTICPYAAEMGDETDPAKAMWLCDDCQSERAAAI